MTTHNEDVQAIAVNLQLEHKNLDIVAAKSDEGNAEDNASEEDQAVGSITEISQNQEALAQFQVDKQRKSEALR